MGYTGGTLPGVGHPSEEDEVDGGQGDDTHDAADGCCLLN